MVSSLGHSPGYFNPKIHCSGSEEDLHLVMDQRKRKRMLSNRESARRSRMRKQKHLDDMTIQLTELGNEHSRFLDDITVTTQHYLDVEAQNSVLKARMAELSQRLQSLNDILIFLDNSTSPTGVLETHNHAFQTGSGCGGFMMNTTDTIYHSQPIMASADMFQW